MSRETEYSQANENEESERAPLLAEPAGNDMPTETNESPSGTSWGKFQDFYSKNIGLFYVLLAQLFASIVRTLQLEVQTHPLTKPDVHDNTSIGNWIRDKVPRSADHLRSHAGHRSYLLFLHVAWKCPRLPFWPT